MPERPRPDLDRVREALTEHDENTEREREAPAQDEDEAPEDDGEA